MKDKIIKLGFSSVEVDELLKVSKDIEKDYLMLLKGYPIQYLIGYVNFYGYKILVNDSVLIPRYETEFLVEKTIKYYKKVFNKKLVNVLDIGTGSGAISIALSKEISSNVTAVDVSNDALNVAKKNATENECNIKFIESNLFDKVNDKYDIIISNPPYIDINEEIDESVKKYEPNLALYADNNGLYFYEEILKKARSYLNDKFIIAFEIGWLQADSIKKIIDKYFKGVKTIVEKDLSQKDRYIFIINE